MNKSVQEREDEMFKLTHHTTKSVMNDYVDIKGTGTKTAQGFFK